MRYDLPFEQPLHDIARQIEAIQKKTHTDTPDDRALLQQLHQELSARILEIYSHLTPWQIVQIARHKERPYAADYIRLMCDEFFELHGDHTYRDDHAIIAGPALIADISVMLICHQKGRDMAEKQRCNYGMPHPEGYRKAYRLMQQAEKFGLPLICLIDTPGAFPGLDDEARGQSGAISANLSLMSQLRIPIIAVVIGEGGSGGALAIGIADRVLMLEYSIYTVASPEAAASILWRNSTFAPQAAESMHICARELKRAHVIDEIIPEPLGGAHHHPVLAASRIEAALLRHLAELKYCSEEDLVESRYQKFRAIGTFKRI